MKKSARKELFWLGTGLTAIALLFALGASWSWLDLHGFFCPALQRTHCLRHLEEIAAAKDAYAKDHDLAAGAAVPSETLIEYTEDGWRTLTCPAGGTYSVGVIGEKPACSVPAHVR